MSAFGLGAFFFTTISYFAFPDDTSSFLLLLSVGCFVMCFGSVLFLRIVPEPAIYSALPSNDHTEANPLRRHKSEERKSVHRLSNESGTQRSSLHQVHNHSEDDAEAPSKDVDQTSSLISSSSLSGNAGPAQDEQRSPITHNPYLDLRGFAMIRTADFWLLFSQMGLLTGIGLMTIK